MFANSSFMSFLRIWQKRCVKIYDFSALTFTVCGRVIAGDRCKRSVFLRNILEPLQLGILVKICFWFKLRQNDLQDLFFTTTPQTWRPKHKTLNGVIFYRPKSALSSLHFILFCLVLRFLFLPKEFLGRSQWTRVWTTFCIRQTTNVIHSERTSRDYFAALKTCFHEKLLNNTN